MIRVLLGCVLLTASLGAPSHEGKKNLLKNLESRLVVVKDLAEARLMFPGAEFTPLESNNKTRGVIRYTLGSRVSGDRLVAYGSDNYQWSTAQDVQLTTRYPTSGTGAIVSFVEIVADQSSNIGQAYVVSGGIGYRYITIITEAKNTIWFRYQTSIYGRS